MNNKLEFAQRLRDAMVAVGLEARPGVLLNQFNANYWGRSVSFQAVSRGLRGEAIPEQDKLLVLAGILKIEPEVLRFGEAVRKSVQQHRQRWDEGVGYLERETFDAFQQAFGSFAPSGDDFGELFEQGFGHGRGLCAVRQGPNGYGPPFNT